MMERRTLAGDARRVLNVLGKLFQPVPTDARLETVGSAAPQPGRISGLRPASRRRRTALGATVLSLLAVIPAVVMSQVSPAGAAAFRSPSWPSGWTKVFGTSSVNVFTNWGAFDTECSNADRTHEYTYYLSGRDEHLGLDLGRAANDPVFAIANGKVTDAGVKWGASSFDIVFVEHKASNGDVFTVAYGHLNNGTNPRTGAPWKAGDNILAGETVGTIHVAGTGAHLHLGLAPGSHTYVAPTSRSAGANNTPCTHQPSGTVDPLEYLSARSAATGETPPPPPVAHNPVGNLDLAERVGGGVRLAGWARDDDNAGAAIQVQTLIDGNPVGGTSTAGNHRADVGNHGFDFTVPMDARPHQVCAKAFNIGGGSDVTLTGCVQVAQLFHDPEGHLDSVVRVDGGHVRLVGWASDADVEGAVQVQALVDGALAGQTTANTARADVGVHGFDFVVATDWRSRQVCAKALNAGGGGVDVLLDGCVQVPYALCPDTPPTINSTRTKDDILGTAGDDVIWATGGGARIAGSPGNDVICGGGASGGPGGNQIIGGPGSNLIFTGPGNNDVVAGPGHTQVISGGGHNRIAVCPSTVVLNLGPQDEVRPSGNCGTPTGNTAEVAGETRVPPPLISSSETSTVPPPTTARPPTISPPPPATESSSTPTSPEPAANQGPPAGNDGPALCGRASVQAPGSYAVAGTDGADATVRVGPTTYHAAAYDLEEGARLAVVCYLDSTPVNGNSRWNRLSDGMWIPDAYTNTPKS